MNLVDLWGVWVKEKSIKSDTLILWLFSFETGVYVWMEQIGSNPLVSRLPGM